VLSREIDAALWMVMRIALSTTTLMNKALSISLMAIELLLSVPSSWLT